MKIHIIELYQVLIRKRLKFMLIFFLFVCVSGILTAQEGINTEVRVVKPYTPTLSDANRINFLPEFKDTANVRLTFDYEIFPKRYATNFRVKPISPARMVAPPLKRLYKSQLTVGFGNYLTPYAELTVNQLRDRKNAIGLYLKHHSSGGNIKLENDKKVDADFSDNVMEIYGRKMMSKSVFEGSVNAGYNSFLYYGYNPEMDTVLQKDDIRQRIYSVGAHVKYYTSNPDSSHHNYSGALDYNYTMDGLRNFEHRAGFEVNFGTFIKDWYAEVETETEIFGRNEEIDSMSNTAISINPHIVKSKEEWRFLVGFNGSFDSRRGLSFFPRVEFEFNIVKNVLIPYLGIIGYKEVNSYRNMLKENPFVMPGMVAENTDYNAVAFAGLKGRYSSKMAFDFRIKYSQMSFMHFFVNSVKDTLCNQFDVVYDDVSILNAGGEITWNQSEKLKFLLKGDYFSYDMGSLEYPWHKPDFTASLNTSYNLRDKILLDANIFYTGKRYILQRSDINDPGESISLKPYIDVNLAAEYRYTKMLSFFVRINNLTASRYQEWYQYPVQRFQFLGGFTYAL